MTNSKFFFLKKSSGSSERDSPDPIGRTSLY
jgi:hypothetical protein